MKTVVQKYNFKAYILNAILHAFLIIAMYIPSSSQEMELDTIYTHFDNIGVKDGLHSGYIKKIFFDQDGYLWICTPHGLQKYDGYKFTNFNYNPEDKYSIPNFFITQLMEDNNGNLWLKTNKHRVFIFEKSKERFIELDMSVVSMLTIDKNNNLYFVNREAELCLLPIIDIPTDHNIVANSWCENNVEKLSFDNSVIDLKTDRLHFHPNGELWTIHDFELTTYTIDISAKRIRAKNSITLKSDGFENNKVRLHLFINENTNESYLFFKDEYCILDNQSGKILKCYQLPKGYIFPRPELIGPEGKLWLSNSGKILTLDLNTNKLTQLNRDKSTTILGENINGRELVKDKYGNIWIPTNGYGIYKYASNKKRFQYFGDNNEGPAISKLISLDFSVLFNYSNRTDVFFDKKRNKVIAFPNSNQLIACNNTNINVKSIKQDSMLNTFIELYCPESKQCYQYKLDADGKITSAIKQTECKKNYAEKCSPIALLDNWSLCRQWNDSDTKLHIQLIENRESQKQPSDSMSYSVSYDTTVTADNYRNPELFSKNNLWFGYRNAGLLQFNVDSKNWRRYKFTQNDSISLSSDVVYDIIEDPHYPDSLLWIATNKGINILDFVNYKIYYLQREDGLPNNVVNTMLADSRKNIWASTNNGLAFIDYQTKAISSFYKSDGLQHEEFNVQASAETNDGYLYFGGMGGLTYFDPEIFYKDSTKSKVVINDFKILNESIPYKREIRNESDSNHPKKPIDSPQTIIVDYDQKMLSFSFSVLDLTDPSRNEYRYMLEGFNDRWISLGTKNEATFTNLSPGLYTLNFQGKNYTGVWSDVNNFTKIRVLAPWWMTIWFKILIICLIAGIIYALYKYRTIQKEKIQALKNRISKDLHDEIGSTLSSIALYSMVAEKKIKPDQKEVHSILNKINESSTTVMESINDIVWTIGSGNENMKEIINRLRAFTSELMLSNQEIHYEIQPKLLDREVGMIIKRNIYLILKEAINNAYKYSKASLIKIEIIEKGGKIVISITDNGIGFDLDNIQNRATLGGNGLRNIESRAKEIGGNLRIVTQKDQGTKIEITFSLK